MLWIHFPHIFLITRSGALYRCPIKGSAAPPRCSERVSGKHTLQTIVKRFGGLAGIAGNYTNHSGKVTGVTTLPF